MFKCNECYDIHTHMVERVKQMAWMWGSMPDQLSHIRSLQYVYNYVTSQFSLYKIYMLRNCFVLDIILENIVFTRLFSVLDGSWIWPQLIWKANVCDEGSGGCMRSICLILNHKRPPRTPDWKGTIMKNMIWIWCQMWYNSGLMILLIHLIKSKFRSSSSI